MTTRTEAIVASAEVASAVAVVVTLVILIMSVRENTAVLRATAGAESRETLARMSDVDLMLGQPHMALLLRSQQPTLKPDDFTEVEMMHLTTAQRAFFRRAEAQYFRYRNGLLDEDAWQTVRHRVWVNIQSPTEVAIWRSDRAGAYTPGFVEAVESYVPPR
jgi:hypothetical protein